jgi:hypothetical protein
MGSVDAITALVYPGLRSPATVSKKPRRFPSFPNTHWKKGEPMETFFPNAGDLTE